MKTTTVWTTTKQCIVTMLYSINNGVKQQVNTCVQLSTVKQQVKTCVQ